jgi:hypothetical protein
MGLLHPNNACAQTNKITTQVYTPTTQTKDSVFIFAYFKNNGQDGLHLAYSNNGLQWATLKKDSSFLTPTVSKDKLMRDPCIIQGADGLFHMVWTVSWNDKGIGYAESKDLIHWSEQQFIPVMQQEDSARNCWAPEITYDARNHQYMIYWATTIRGKYAADPAVEAGYNHRIYYTLTKDFKKYSPTTLLYDKGFNVIDATIVPDGKNFIMFLKDETRTPVQKNIKIATSKTIDKDYSDASAPITGNYWAEGPTTIRLNGKWIVYFDKYRDHRYGAVQSSNLKDWEDISDKINIPAGLRHGTILKVSAAVFAKMQNAIK